MNRYRDSRVVKTWGKSTLAGLILWVAVVVPPAANGESGDRLQDHRPSLLSDEWYSEGWDQTFYYPDGSLTISQITVLNIGFGSHHAGVFAMYVAPDGRKTIVKQSRSNREWEFSEDVLDLRIAEHRLEGSPPRYQALIRKKTDEVDISFESLGEPWRLGKTLERDGGYQYVSFYAPIADASGRFRLGKSDGSDAPEWHQLEGGRGFAVRYVNSIGLHDLIRSATRIVDLERSEISPVIYTSVEEDGAVQNHIALFRDGRIIHTSHGFELETGGRPETADDDVRNIPDNYRIAVEEEGFSLSGTIRIDKFLARVDPVDSLKPFVRTIVKLLNTPIQYRYLAKYDLDYVSGGQTVRLQGRALMDHMVLRHERKQADRSKNTR